MAASEAIDSENRSHLNLPLPQICVPVDIHRKEEPNEVLKDPVSKRSSLQRKFSRTLSEGDTCSPNRVVSTCEPAPDILPKSPNRDAQKFEHLYRMGEALEEEGKHDDAIEAYERAVRIALDSHPRATVCHIRLGMALKRRFDQLSDEEDFHKAIYALERALACASTDGSLRDNEGTWHRLLLELLEASWRLTKDQRVEDPLVACATNAVRLDPNNRQSHLCLGRTLLKMADAGTGWDTAYLSEFLQSSAIPLEDLAELEMALVVLFQSEHDMRTLDHIVATCEYVIERYPKHDPRNFDHLCRLGRAFKERGLDSHAIHAYEHAIDVASDLTPLTGTSLEQLGQLGFFLGDRFRRCRDVKDLDRSIRALKIATDCSLEDEQEPYCQSLCRLLKERWDLFKDVADLESMVAYATTTVALNSNDLEYHISLVDQLHKAFEDHSALSLLNLSITTTQKILLSIQTSDDRARALCKLGYSYYLRLRHSDGNDSFDGHLCATCFDEAESIKKLDVRDYFIRAHAIFTVGSTRSDAQYIAKAASMWEKLFNQGLLQGSHRHHLLLRMASAKANIFYLGDAKDVGLLDQAIEWAKLAIDCAVPPESELDAQIEAYGMLSALLAYRLVDRYCRGPTDAVPVPDSPRSAADPFNDAMLVAKKVVSLTSKGSALYPAALLQHAFNTLLYGRVFSSKETRRQAMSEFRCAAEAAGNDLRVRTQALLGWASTAYDIQDWYSCMRAHQKLLNNVEDLVWLGLSTSQQIQLISREELGVCELGSHSARAAVCNGSIATALGWLDQCRSIAWQKISNLRVSSTRLARIAPDLARELQVVSRTLEEGTFQDHLSGVGGDVAYEVDRQRRHRAAEEWNHLINKVRSVQGFESFLRPKTAEQLSSLDLDGYVVVLNVHEDRCDAFILHGGITDIRLCRLDPMRLNQAIATNLYYKLQSATTRSNLSRGDELRRSVPCHGRNPNKIMADVLSDLWDSLVKPILDFINLEPYNKGSTPPRLWWCPNGPLTFLPLHAAGLYDTSNRGTKVYEYVASSYTPTVSMLADKLDRQHLENLKGFLAVSQPSGNPSIPKTVEEVESVVAVTKQHDPAMEILWLNETGATAKSVLDGMTEYSWIHLACHASQDHINPLDSEFMLYDRPLKLSEIAAHAHPHADFAFLSACQTATGDPKTMEEAVHLAAGMLVVGFRSVVATMWSVRDRDAPIVADAFYQKLFSSGKVNGGMSGIALHHAIMTLRERVGAEEFMSWVPFIHVGA